MNRSRCASCLFSDPSERFCFVTLFPPRVLALCVSTLQMIFEVFFRSAGIRDHLRPNNTASNERNKKRKHQSVKSVGSHRSGHRKWLSLEKLDPSTVLQRGDYFIHLWMSLSHTHRSTWQMNLPVTRRAEKSLQYEKLLVSVRKHHHLIEVIFRNMNQ